MPKETFYNLPEYKKEVIIRSLRDEFESCPFYESSVVSVIKRANIPRGSFYQYFEDLEESFFTILDMEISESHDLFLKALNDKDGDVFEALSAFGPVMVDEIFAKFNLYRNRYLYWNCELDMKWKDFRKRNQKEMKFFRKDKDTQEIMNPEKMHFINAIIQKMIERLFMEKWDRDEFLQHYSKYIEWIQNGIQ